MTSAGSAAYAYTSENLLTSATGGTALAYDPAMRLYQTSGGSAGTTRFGYDGTALIAEYNGSNFMLRRYVHGPGADEPLAWYEGSGTTDRRFLHADERGSVVAVTNNSGTTLNVNGYDEYGIPSSGNAGRFQYTGQTWLPELGMYYYKARIYSPTLGRFLQTDPIGYGDGMNMYAYVKGDPVNFTDPSGLEDDALEEQQIITITGQRPAGGSGAIYPDTSCGIGAGATPVCNPAQGLDDFMYRWWLTGIYDQWQVRYNTPPFEPTLHIYEDMEVEEAKMEFTKITCPDGTVTDFGASVSQSDPNRELIAIAHWHQGYGIGGVIGYHSPWPGVGDGLIVQRRGIHNYVSADSGLTVIRPGPTGTIASIDILGNNGLPSGGPPSFAAVTRITTGGSKGGSKCD